MLIDDVRVSDSAAAQLALLADRAGDRALALHLGLAIDHLRDFVPVERDLLCISRLLATECPASLEGLRNHLRVRDARLRGPQGFANAPRVE